MKVSDYIVEFLIKHNIRDVFGYPGGMVTHLMDSLDKYREHISVHLNYHEQACAMAACAWAEITGLPGVAYATSGPGATNLLTGIACAYFDSIPCIFITGQVNTYEQKKDMPVRQKGFQETDIVSMAKPITKTAYMVESVEDMPAALDKAYYTSLEGRPGPVLLDVPMNIFRGNIDERFLPDTSQTISSKITEGTDMEPTVSEILCELQAAHSPVILAGHGIALSKTIGVFRKFVDQTGIPTVTSMTGVDVLQTENLYTYGMIGAYGSRWANYILDHSDCILTLGSRLDCRQTGVDKALFAPRAQILRVDIDADEMENRINKKERHYCISLEELMPALAEKASGFDWDFHLWNRCCKAIREELELADQPQPGNQIIRQVSSLLPEGVIVTTDVGQNQVWVAQSWDVKKEQRILFSGGHGAMGYGLPAAIGAAIAVKRPVICVAGDGGFQMNIQELQTVMRERIPIKIILLNNHTLGMIHHFQEIYFQSNFVQTQGDRGFTVPNFKAIARAYGMRVIDNPALEILPPILLDMDPAFIEIPLPQNTYIFPKLGLNKPIHEQEPTVRPEISRKVKAVYDAFLNENRSHKWSH
ncbi:thiamine pyrophosphate-binding protein [bacterium D16-76]|nr:thiamine pyrophosphate-binding protein [bacterium D16-76]